MPIDVFVGLGSNLEAPARQLARAAGDIAAIDGVALIARSSLYASAPVGYADQPDFVNAAVHIRTELAPRALLDALQAIERRQGRQRSFRNAPRTLDLDILIHGDLQLQEAGLTLPHPRCHERAFVLLPLLEIAPDCVIPGKGPARHWLASVEDQRIARCGGFDDGETL